jgi:hypothetical protein
MSKAFCRSKAQSKHIFDVTGLQLALNMTIVLFVHTFAIVRNVPIDDAQEEAQIKYHH